MMTAPNANLFPHGARWVRADFHMHTAKDKQWKLEEREGMKAEEFVSHYVGRMRGQEIGVGVVTNHNKFDQDEFKTLSKAVGKAGMFLLPGVELSVQGGSSGIHVLVVFDPITWI